MTWISRLVEILAGRRYADSSTLRDIVERMDAARDSYAERMINEGKRDLELGSKLAATDVIERGEEKVRLGRSLREGEAGLMQALGLDPEELIDGVKRGSNENGGARGRW